MCPEWLVFSTSKKTARRPAGSGASGTGGGTRAEKSGSGVASGTTGSCSGAVSSTSGSERGATSEGGLVFAALERRCRPALVRSMPAS